MENQNNLGALLPINENNGQRAVNARDLHSFLESKQQFADWMKNRIDQYGFIEGQDYQVFMYDYQGNLLHKIMKSDNQYVSKVEYALSIDMAKELSMVERNEKGKQARRYFIVCEDKLKEVVSKGHIATRNTKPSSLSIEDQVKLMSLACKEMKASKADKNAAMNNLLMQNGLPPITFSVQTNGKSALSAKDLIQIHNLNINSENLFALMKAHGYVETRQRSTTTTKNGVSNYSVLTEKGEKWGFNEPSRYASNKYDIRLYKETFPQLWNEIKP